MSDNLAKLQTINTSQSGHLIAVLGGKGGVGKSIFSANLAIAFQGEAKRSVLLLDIDPKTVGDQRVILGLNEKTTLYELVQKQTKLDERLCEKTFTPHKSGIFIATAGSRPEEVAALNKESLDPYLRTFLRAYPYTIADCGSELTDAVLAVIERASMVIVVATPDVLVLNQTKRLVDQLQSMLLPVDMVRVVVNRFSKSSGIQPAMIQNNIRRQVLIALPEEEALCAQSLTRGIPILMAAPSAELSRAYVGLARTIRERQWLEQAAALKRPSLKTASSIGSQGVAVQTLKATGTDGAAARIEAAQAARHPKSSKDPRSALKLFVHDRLREQMDLKKVDTDIQDPQKRMVLHEKTKKVVLDILEKEDHPWKQREELGLLVKEILDEALYLGPLEDMLADTTVSEIMVNKPDLIYIERGGKVQRSKITFSGTQQVLNVIDRIVAPIGRRIDEKTPYVDGRLMDGSRVHAIIPPLAIQGPTITIRKFPSNRLKISDLVKFGSMTADMGDFLRSCVEAKLNIVISGGTGSGKTTLLNVLAGFIPSDERIITVEDAAELDLPQEHWIRLETRPANIEGEGAVTIRDLVKQTLRMRPERIVVGECRSSEALDMLQAMNTGHDGSMTTIHSNTPRDCLRRLETLVMMAGMELPSQAIREQVASAVNLIVQQSRLSDGSRKITHISEITGMQGEVITSQDIFLFKQEGIDKNRKVIGKFVSTGFIPKFITKLEEQGIRIPRGIFSTG